MLQSRLKTCCSDFSWACYHVDFLQLKENKITWKEWSRELATVFLFFFFCIFLCVYEANFTCHMHKVENLEELNAVWRKVIRCTSVWSRLRYKDAHLVVAQWIAHKGLENIILSGDEIYCSNGRKAHSEMRKSVSGKEGGRWVQSILIEVGQLWRGETL